MTRTIILQGKMGELFGKTHKLNVKSIQEAMHALDCLKGGVKRYLMECQDLGIHFTIQKGGTIKEYAQAGNSAQTHHALHLQKPKLDHCRRH